MTSSVAAFEAAIRIKSMYITKSWLKTRKKKIQKYTNVYTNFHLKYCLPMEFTTC